MVAPSTMTALVRGAAFLDESRSVLAADDGFLAALGLPAQSASAGLLARAAVEPTLSALLGGAGPPVVTLRGAGDALLELERLPSTGGLVLLLRSPDDQARLERAGLATSLARLAEGLAHDVKNALNAMALQLALVAEKLDAAAGATVRTQLSDLHAQVAKVDDLVRRFVDVAAPAADASLDLSAVLVDLAGLHTHALRRGHLRLDLRRPPASAPLAAVPARAVGLLLALFGTAVGEAADDTALEIEILDGPEHAAVTLRYTAAAAGAPPGPDVEVAAGCALALGGGLERSCRGQGVSLALRLPRGEAAR
jgi:hypothetical protein